MRFNYGMWIEKIYLIKKITIWFCIGGILAIWNMYLYQNGVDEIAAPYDLAAYITTGSGYGYMALHLSIYPIVCCTVIYMDTMKLEPSILLRMGKKKFINSYYYVALRNSILFCFIFTGILYISVSLRCSESFWNQINFMLPCSLYLLAIIVQYTMLTYIFVTVFTFMLKRERAICIVAILYILLWTIIYTFNVSLFTIQSTMLNEFYNGGINLLKYVVQITRQIAGIGIIYLIGQEVFSRKDIL